jgi:hypothetical protein
MNNEQTPEKGILEEIVDGLVKKTDQLENKLTEKTNMQILDYGKHLDRFGKQLNGFDEKINAIPKEIPGKTTVQFDTKSKFVVKILICTGLLILILLAAVISLWIENGRRAEDKNKYIIVQGLYPKTANYIDSIYINNSDSLLKVARTNIEKQKKLSDAAFEAKQADDKLQ